MLNATFDFDTTKTSNMYRKARIAMLTHQALIHIERMDESVDRVEKTLAEWIEANRPDRAKAV